VLLVALAGGGVVAWRTGELSDWWHDLRGDSGAGGPAAVAAPEGVDAPAVVRPPAVGRPVDRTGRPVAAKVRAALATMHARALGPHVLAAVGPLAGKGYTYRFASSGRFLATPASTTKIVTTTAALFALGPDHTFRTRTVLAGAGRHRRLVLVGGGDPYLMPAPVHGAPQPTYDLHRADVTTLAVRTAAALRHQGVRRLRLGFDDSLFSGPAVNARWEPDYVSTSVVAPTDALWVDDGLSPVGYGRSADPALAATQVFAKALVKHGITVVGRPTRTVAPDGATEVAAVSSAPLADIVQRILQVSDNDGAEVLLRQVGVAEAGQGSIAAGRRAVRQILAANGIAMQGSVLYDGSGLSRHDLMSPGLLLDVLRLDASKDHPGLRPVLEGLPVAGFNGSLADRMDGSSPEGRGRVRAKTGTLTGVSSLAGIAVGRDGVPMVFVLMADRISEEKELQARNAEDDAAAALGACRCG